MSTEFYTVRTVTQLTAVQGNYVTLFALCGDGTLWMKQYVGHTDANPANPNETPWQAIANVPQT